MTRMTAHTFSDAEHDQAMQAELRRLLTDAERDAALRYAVQMWRFVLDVWDPNRGRDTGRPPPPTIQCDAIPYVPGELAEPAVEGGSILDVGSLAGYGLYDSARRWPGVTRLRGVDIDARTVALGRRLADVWAGGLDVGLEQADARQLPFETASFRLVVARLVLPYVRVRDAIGEMARVLEPGGAVLFQVHAFPYYARRLRRSLGNARTAFYFIRPMISGALFRATGRQPRHPWFSEVAMSRAWLTRLCRSAGLEGVWSGGFAPRPVVIFRKTKGFGNDAEALSRQKDK